jgi:hypothetical protein
MGYNCKNTNGYTYDVAWGYLNNGWVPAVTMCGDHLYSSNTVEVVPDVKNATTEIHGLSINISWDLNARYYTVVDFKVDDGAWVPLVTVDQNTNTTVFDSYNYEGIGIGNNISFRLKHCIADLSNCSLNYVITDPATIENLILFKGTAEPNLSDFFNFINTNDAESFSVDGNNILCSNPASIIYIDVNDYGINGELNVSGCVNMEYIYAVNCGITKFTAINCATSYLDIYNNDITDLIVSYCPNLDEIYADNNNLTSIHFKNEYGLLNNIDLSGNSELSSVIIENMVGDGGKSYLDVGQCNMSVAELNKMFGALGTAAGPKNYLYVGLNPGEDRCNITIAVDKGWSVDGGPTIIYKGTNVDLEAFNNAVTWQDGGEDEHVVFHFNQYYCVTYDSFYYMRTIDFSEIGNNALGYLYLNQGDMTEINISGTRIIELHCNNNDLTTLVLTDCPNLSVIDGNSCGSVGAMDFDGCSELAYISLAACGITSVSNLDHKTNLVNIYMANNSNLETLDLTGCTSLETVGLTECDLNTVTLTGCTNLGFNNGVVDVHNNSLDATALNNIYTALPTAYTESNYVYIYNNPGNGTSDETIATNKDWIVID